MDPIKEAFTKIKEDIQSLRNELYSLREDLNFLKNQSIPTTTPTQNHSISPSQTNNPTQIPTQNMPSEALKSQNYGFSTRNEGVPTNKPTNQQTNQHPPISTGNPNLSINSEAFEDFRKAKETLDSLDNIKKGIRKKFKGLTDQEMNVFSTIYTLESQNYDEITYKKIAKLLELSEASIRDYVNRIITKGVPVLKSRKNNKKIVLSISEDLKSIATLDTILRLRAL